MQGRRSKEKFQVMLDKVMKVVSKVDKGSHTYFIDALYPAGEGTTLLCAACLLNDMKAVRWLVDHGADISAESNLGRYSHEHTSGLYKNVTPVGIAITTHNDELFDFLFEKRDRRFLGQHLIEPYRRAGRNVNSILELACSEQNEHVVNVMLDKPSVMIPVGYSWLGYDHINDHDFDNVPWVPEENASMGLFHAVKTCSRENMGKVIPKLLAKQEVNVFEPKINDNGDDTDAMEVIVTRRLPLVFLAAVEQERVASELRDPASLNSIHQYFSDILNRVHYDVRCLPMLEWCLRQDYRFDFRVQYESVYMTVENGVLALLMNADINPTIKLDLLKLTLGKDGVTFDSSNENDDILITFVSHLNSGKRDGRNEFNRDVLKLLMTHSNPKLPDDLFLPDSDLDEYLYDRLVEDINLGKRDLTSAEKDIALMFFFNGVKVSQSLYDTLEYVVPRCNAADFVLNMWEYSENRYEFAVRNIDYLDFAVDAWRMGRLDDNRVPMLLLNLCTNRAKGLKLIPHLPAEMIFYVVTFVIAQ